MVLHCQIRGSSRGKMGTGICLLTGKMGFGLLGINHKHKSGNAWKTHTYHYKDVTVVVGYFRAYINNFKENY